MKSNHRFSLMLVYGLAVGVVGPFRNASSMPKRKKFRSHGKGPQPMRLLPKLIWQEVLRLTSRGGLALW